MTEEKIELVYDDQCPVCRSYCTNLSLDNLAARLELIDARKGGTLVNDITSRELDIDEGMVVKIGNDLFYGSDAIHQLALRAQNKGWTGWINRLFFQSPRLGRIFYALGKKLRNAVLTLYGIEKIRNLKTK